MKLARCPVLFFDEEGPKAFQFDSAYEHIDKDGKVDISHLKLRAKIVHNTLTSLHLDQLIVAH